MERSLERYYTEFEPPPLAPVYHPSEEEFADPIAYVASIRAEAQQYGVVKIVPPANFRPPFAVDPTRFEFTPRVQRLNEIDAFFCLRIIFINKLVSFWHLQGQQFRLPFIDNRYIDLYRVHALVSDAGGVETVNREKRWAQIAKEIGFKPAHGGHLRGAYVKWVVPFDQALGTESVEEDGLPAGSKSKPQPAKEQTPPPSSSATTTPTTTTTEPGRMRGRTRLQTARMTGTVAATSSSSASSIHLPSRKSLGGDRSRMVPAAVQRKRGRLTIETMRCRKCGRGDDEARLLLCDSCNLPCHIYCLEPPLAGVPKGEWRCAPCVSAEVKKTKFEFGFHDSNQTFTLASFQQLAHEFKTDYFAGIDPRSVSQQRVEAEYWANLVTFDKTVAVKYGADLISSKVGSGFPRRNDLIPPNNTQGNHNKGGGDCTSKERLHYANHPWNLNNLPVLRESVLSHININISGMMVPWVYVGMCFSTFCWHVEDHWTYSINYNHLGERKIWYGVGADDAEQFDEIVREAVPELFRDQPDLLHHMTTAINPRYLIDKGLRVYSVHQNAGEFVVTFPRAYHAGYNEGFNFAEAVNFAPPDWLHIGRLCLNNYQAVGRTCVFAHEELVMRMVEVAERMSIGMCMAALEELRFILSRETDFRKQLALRGCQKREFSKFEDVDDDLRTCCICRTTIFMSALVCCHSSRIVCMNHVDQLCEKCGIKDCCLRYRYTLEDLVPLAKKLTKRTTTYEEWRIRVGELLALVTAGRKSNGAEGERRLSRTLANAFFDTRTVRHAYTDSDSDSDVVELRELEASWRSHRYPQCSEIRAVQEAIKRFDSVSAPINQTINRKIRLRLAANTGEGLTVELIDTSRDNTRYQKADTRQDFAELEQLREQLAHCDVFDPTMEKAVNALCSKVEKWRSKLAGVVASSRAHYDGQSAVEHLKALQSEADEFNLRVPEMDMLRNELARCEWLHRVRTTIESIDGWRKAGQHEGCINGHMGDQQQLTSLAALARQLDEAGRWTDSCGMVRDAATRLKQLRKEGFEGETNATKFLSGAVGVGFGAASKWWRSRRLGWLDADSVNRLREEMEVAKKLHERYTQLTEDSQQCYSLRELEQLEAQCGDALFERGSATHLEITALRDRLETFTNQLWVMFQRVPSSYYATFEIIAGREDLPVLLEGDPLPLSRFESATYDDNWDSLSHFDSAEQLSSHLAMIAGRQGDLLDALRRVNIKRPLKETCSCSGTATARPSSGDTDFSILCFVCNSAFHIACAQWDPPFFDHLPEGLFLCMRCLRSKRPSLEELKALCCSAPQKSLEFIAVKHLIDSSSTAFAQLRSHIQSITSSQRNLSEPGLLELERLAATALSFEVIDQETFKLMFASPHLSFSLSTTTSSGQVEAWRALKAKATPTPTNPAQQHLFHIATAVSGGGGRKRNRRSSPPSSTAPSSSTRVATASTANNSLASTERQSGGQSRKRTLAKREIYHADGDVCAAEKCLQPYSDQVRWIQCDSFGCERWYHYVCVGLTTRMAQTLSAYSCQKCGPTSGSSA